MLDRSNRRIYSKDLVRSTVPGEAAFASAGLTHSALLFIGVCLFWGFILFFALAPYLS